MPTPILVRAPADLPAVPDLLRWAAMLRAWAAALPAGLARLAEAERGRPALWLPVAMAAGAALWFSLSWQPAWWGPPLLLLLAAVPAVALRSRRPAAAALFALLAAGSLGASSAELAAARAPDAIDLPRRAVRVDGVVRANETLPEGRRLVIDRPALDDAAPLPRSVRIRLRAGDGAAVVPGDTVRLRAMLSPPAQPSYPGAWDLQRDAWLAGIGGYGYALGRTQVLSHAPPSSLAQVLAGLRQAIAARVAAVLPGTEGAIGATLLTGTTAQIPEADRAAFRDSGLAHLLAIAGLHIGIVMGLAWGGVRLALSASEHAALRWPCKSVAACTALAAGGAYMLLTGAHVPIMRSFAMASVVALGVLTGRRAVSLRGWALAMAALVLVSPGEVMGVSFQMSFSAVLALIAGYEALRPWLRRIRHRRLLAHVASLALTSALAGTFSAPFAAYHFGHVQLYNVVANVVAVPITALWVMPAGLLALALMPLHLEAAALLPMGWGIAAIDRVGSTVASWPGAVLDVPHMPAWGLGVLAFGLLWAGLWRSRLRWAGAPVVLAGLLSPALGHPPDVLVSETARMIAVRTDAAAELRSRGSPDRFVRDAWRVLWGGAVLQPMDCTAQVCPLGNGALLLHGEAPDVPTAELCAASLLVSDAPLRLHCPAGHRPAAIDRFTVFRDGAAAAWLGPDGATVETDRSVRGDRPWVAHPPWNGRAAPGLVPAERDKLGGG